MTADKQVGYVPELGWAPPQVHLLLAIADGAFRERRVFYNTMGEYAQRHGYE
jgi:hypothetical protein